MYLKISVNIYNKDPRDFPTVIFVWAHIAYVHRQWAPMMGTDDKHQQQAPMMSTNDEHWRGT